MKTKLICLLMARAAIGLAVGSQIGSPVTPSPPTDPNISPHQVEPIHFQDLPRPGEKCQVNDDFYFIYEFTEKTKIGTTILRLQVFDQSGTKSAPFVIRGRYDMPSMAGAHDSGEQEFKLNKKNDYLLPIHIVMPGEWEVKLTFFQGESAIFRGVFRFHV